MLKIKFKGSNYTYYKSLQSFNYTPKKFLFLNFYNLNGKTYKWVFSKNNINVNLLSHNKISFFFNNHSLVYSKKLSKKSLFFMSVKSLYFKSTALKKYDIFTNTGFQVQPSYHFQKQGKVSSYMIC